MVLKTYLWIILKESVHIAPMNRQFFSSAISVTNYSVNNALSDKRLRDQRTGMKGYIIALNVTVS